MRRSELSRELRRTKRPVELRRLIPNLMTAAALIGGCAAVHYAHLGRFDKAVAMIGAAFILDGLDGRVARMLKATSRFGEKFDSIADFMSFGIAPALVIYLWQLKSLEAFGLVIAGVYTLCAAYRLARFTRLAKQKAVDAPVSKYFMGFPAPGASAAVLVPVMLELSDLHLTLPIWATSAWSLVISGLMVSRLPMISVKHIRIGRAMVMPLLLGFATLVLLAFRDAWLTFAALSTLYALSLPVGLVLHTRGRRHTPPGGEIVTRPDAMRPVERR